MSAPKQAQARLNRSASGTSAPPTSQNASVPVNRQDTHGRLVALLLCQRPPTCGDAGGKKLSAITCNARACAFPHCRVRACPSSSGAGTGLMRCTADDSACRTPRRRVRHQLRSQWPNRARGGYGHGVGLRRTKKPCPQGAQWSGFACTKTGFLRTGWATKRSYTLRRLTTIAHGVLVFPAITQVTLMLGFSSGKPLGPGSAQREIRESQTGGNVPSLCRRDDSH